LKIARKVIVSCNVNVFKDTTPHTLKLAHMPGLPDTVAPAKGVEGNVVQTKGVHNTGSGPTLSKLTPVPSGVEVVSVYVYFTHTNMLEYF
jgi:hypothetical protein